jgi:type IV pilus assembly protein PilY1
MKRNTSSIDTIKRRLATGLATALAAAGAALFQPPAVAEDIDLFVQPPSATSGTPNVLIVLDNTANWSTQFVEEIGALVDTIDGLPVNDDGSAQFRVGLMMFSETGSPNNATDGGYVRAAVRDFTAANKTVYMNLLNSLHVNNDKSNNGKPGLTMMEAYYYFSGQNPRSGNNKVKTDYTNNNTGTAASKAIYALPENALPAFAGSPYNSPVIDGSCGQNFIVYISNSAPQDNNSDTVTSRNGLQAEGGDTTTIPISPSGSMGNMSDEWARFMEASPYGITTYTVDVDRATTGQGPGATALLKSMANVSRGKYFDVNSAAVGGTGNEILLALQTIFSEIQAVNTVFASVSLPVSVNASGTYLNQIYIAMFRPDRDGFPRWVGNMKQYKLGLGNGRLQTQDADSVSAVNSSTGFITECARSFWTPTTVDTYWAFSPQGACLAVAGSKDSNYPDGNVVEKGAQAYELRAETTNRSPFKTCSAASCTALTDFNDANTDITEGALGAANAGERSQLINWASGQDIDDENTNGHTTQMRPSFHGDVLHSRPVAINMGTDASPEVVVFYAGNDGVLRAVNGNRSASIGSIAAGEEMWAFMAPEFYGHIKRLRDNLIPINFFGNTFPAPEPKPYGLDGPLTAHRSGSNLWLYASARRGSRSVYAFDVSTIHSSPSSPTLKWRKGCTNPDMADTASCTTGLEQMGQTWSTPRVLNATGYSGGTAPMLIMGGGYDTCEDGDPHTCGSTPKGNQIYVLDADTGAKVPVSISTPGFTTDRSVVADVAVITDEATGLAKWAYAADLGGNVYRISGIDANTEFADTPPADWTMTKIASLGCDDGSASCSATGNRKFLMGVDVVHHLDGSYAILVGSGDREKPLMGFDTAYGVTNYFFKITDQPTDPDWLAGEGPTGNGNCTTDIICLDSLLTIGAGDPDANDLLAHPKGWKLELNLHEQVVTSAITVFGTTTFSTHVPTVPAVGGCTSNLGTARVYNINYTNAAPKDGATNRGEIVVGGGLPPSPVAGMVTLDDGTTMPFIIGADPNSPLEGLEPVPSALAEQPKAVTYWYIHK